MECVCGRGEMGGGKKGKKDGGGRAGSNLGRSIIKHQFPSAKVETNATAIETERGKHKLRSVTQCDDLEELMSQVHASLC